MRFIGVLLSVLVVSFAVSTILYQTKPNPVVVIQSLKSELYLKSDLTFTSDIDAASTFSIDRAGVLTPDLNNDTLSFKPFGGNKTIGYLYNKLDGVLKLYNKKAKTNAITYINKERVYKFKEECEVRLICRSNC